MKRITIKFTLAIIILLFAWTNLRSYKNTVKFQRIAPGNPIFILKRVVEKIQYRIIIINGQKIDFENELIEKRLSELETIVSNNDINQIEKASSRYITQVQSAQMPSIVLTDDTVIRLENIKTKYEYGSAYWLSIQQAIDVTNAYLH